MLYMDEKYLKSKPNRKAPKVSTKDFKTLLYKHVLKINDESEKSSLDAVDMLCCFLDITQSKIIVDTENLACAIWKITDDFVVLRLDCGGDWEMPVTSILYWDGKKFNHYFPTAGNTFNKASMTAFGSESESKYFKGMNEQAISAYKKRVLKYIPQYFVDETDTDSPFVDFEKLCDDLNNSFGLDFEDDMLMTVLETTDEASDWMKRGILASIKVQ